MKNNLIFAFLLFFLCNYGQNEDPSGVSIEKLQGVWAFEKHANKYKPEELDISSLYYYNIQIQDSSIYIFDYPTQLHAHLTFKIVQDSIVYTSVKNYSALKKIIPDPTVFVPIDLKINDDYDDDYLEVIDNPFESVSEPTPTTLSSNGNQLCILSSCYYRVNLDSSTIEKIKKNKFNSEGLIGDWKLQTYYSSGHDGWGMMPEEFPWKMDHELIITKDNVHRFYGGGLFYLKIDSEKRPFEITEIYIGENSGSFELRPYNWKPSKKRIRPFVLIYSYGEDESFYDLNE